MAYIQFRQRIRNEKLLRLHTFRKHSKLILWITVIAFAGSLVLWGVPGRFREKPEPVLEIFGHRFTQEELARIKNRRELALGISRLPTDQLSDFLVMLEEAKRMGIAISDERLRLRIRMFFGLQEDLSQKDYEEAVSRRMGIPLKKHAVEEFEAAIREDLMVRSLVELILSDVPVTEAEAYYAYLRENESIKLTYVAFPTELFGKDSEISEKEMMQRYEDFRKDYTHPEEVALDYIMAELENMLEGVEITDEQVAERYEKDKEQYRLDSIEPGTGSDSAEQEPAYKPLEEVREVIRERLRHEHATQEMKTRIKAASDDVNLWLSAKITDPDNPPPPLDFGALAEKHRLEHGETDLFEEASPPEVLQRIPKAVSYGFTHEVGEISPTYDGFGQMIIVRVAEKQPARQLSFGEVKEQIEQEIRELKGRELASRSANEFSKAAAEKKFAQALGELSPETKQKLNFGETGFFLRPSLMRGSFTLIPGLGIKPTLAAAAARLRENVSSEAIEADDGFYVISVAETKPSDPAGFDAKRQQTLTLLRQRKQFELFRSWQESVLERANVRDLTEELTSRSSR